MRSDGQFADFSNTCFTEFEAIVAQLPQYAQDASQLRVGDAGIRSKRWYIEGYERFSEVGKLVGCMPKGIEIRTTIHEQIDETIAELTESFQQLCQVAAAVHYTPALTSFNPRLTRFTPDPPFNWLEQQRIVQSPEEQTEQLAMLTYGPDLNISIEGLSDAKILTDIAKKLTYYSPFLVPFSFSSPFSVGQLWDGLSARTFYRTGRRSAAIAYLEDPKDVVTTQPPLTKPAKLPAEVGRIEFKAFDSCGNFSLYGSLLALLKGLVMEHYLTGRASVPDTALHQEAATKGWNSVRIFAGSRDVLRAARAALAGDPDCGRLDLLDNLLMWRRNQAMEMRKAHEQGDAISQILARGYDAQASAVGTAATGRQYVTRYW
ncbi:MAG: glutamate-cysteine ligase family protein [Cyanobacteria bacterium J06632_22]